MDSNMNSTRIKQIKKSNSVKFIAQNVRGLKSDDRLEDLFAYVARLGVFALCLQETICTYNEVWENGRCMLITTGLPSKNVAGKRGSQGTAIALSHEAIEEWKGAGSELHIDLEARLIAIRLLVKDNKDNDVYVFLVSAYAPVSTAPYTVWGEYYDKLQNCITRRRKEDIPLIGMGSNASMGRHNYTVDDENKSGPRGGYIRNRIAKAGDAFGTIRDTILSSTRMSNTWKYFLYGCIILAILLYGSKTWGLTEALLQELRCFHARCVGSMCRVTP